jgi:Reverse transcriptase (RNA-dependent DNA polymerase)
VKGFAGTKTTNVQIGTLRWSWEDELGRKHTFTIPNSYYVPDGRVRLLSPQHWSQTQTKGTERDKCGEYTNGRECVLFWGGGSFKIRVPLGKRDNVATFPMASGYDKFKAFCCEAELDDTARDVIAMPSGFVSDEEDDDEVEAIDEARLVEAWQIPNDSNNQRTKNTSNNRQTKSTSGNRQATHDLDGPSSTPSKGETLTKASTASTETIKPPQTREQPKTANMELPSTTNVNVILDEEDRQPANDLAELLAIHHQFGHISMAKLQEMAKQGIIPRRLSKCRVPTCSACLYAKATKRPWRNKPMKNGDGGTKPTKPGQVVSVDQLVSPTPGLIAQMTGFLTTKRYRYATVYVDQFSRLGFIYLQKTASAEETVEGKKAFEAYSHRHGVKIENYHADNGIFKAYKWLDACKQDGQGMTFAAVNAHHQNGIAERRIRELQELARAMLMHANARWGDTITANLWPYAVRSASDAINHTPSMQDANRRSPIELFSNSKVATNPKHWKPFGCPTYVLANELQGNRPYHKWSPRSRAGIYLGKSPQHGRNVALVMDRDTALVSPQFHVAYDATFDTVKTIKTKSTWQLKAGFVTSQKEPTRRDKTPTPSQTVHMAASTKKRKRHTPIEQEKAGNPVPSSQKEPAAATIGDDGPPIPINATTTGKSVMGSAPDSRPIQISRYGRTIKPTNTVLGAMCAEISEATRGDIEGEIFCYVAMFPNDDRWDYRDPLLAYKAVSDPDTLYYHQAMREKDREKFRESMTKEVTDQFDNGNFTVIPKSDVPKDQTILPAVWQMRRKRDAKTGSIKKYKARLNIDGSRMKRGEHYDETYAPVASWNSVRMLLTMTVAHGWHTKQIDFVQAFAQAPVEKTLYMRIPAGMDLEDGSDPKDYVLKIHRNIYGQKQAGRVWNQYLVRKLVKDLGFQQSAVDECVFYRGSTLYVLYTDDSLLAGPDKAEIDEIIDELQKKAKLSITVEGDLADFLGVSIDRRPDGTIHLSQPHLIDQILDDLRMKGTNVKSRSTPAASSKLLTRHSDSEPFDNSFNYRSLIGKLNYLEKATRSDIAYAVHQCARFVSDPKKEHGDAVRWLGRYLLGTRDKGTIMQPMTNKDLEVFVDASFCGDWDPKEAAADRDTARSRHGYVINYAGCPLLWKSQLQTEVALSSTESEYTGLSYALRDAIPVMRLLREMKKRGYPIVTTQARVHCRVFEDNSGALEMAKVHKYRPRTKHLNVKLHHFRDYVERKEISIHHIRTNDQPADFLTKPLNEEAHCRHRKTVMGW